MNSTQLDAALDRWLHQQPDHDLCSVHVQIKLWSSEVEMAQLTAAVLAGWVVIDWQHRGRGLSAKRAHPVHSQPFLAAQVLDGISAKQLHAHFQVILAPSQDWANASGPTSLAPDLLPVLDAGHALVLSVSAERNGDDWRIVLAHQPPSDEPIPGFEAALDD